MQPRTSLSRLASRGPSDADLRRIQVWLRWLTIASVVVFVILSREHVRWWGAHAYWGVVAMLAIDLVVGVPVQLLQLYRAWTGPRKATRTRQALGDTYDQIIASRQRRSE